MATQADSTKLFSLKSVKHVRSKVKEFQKNEKELREKTNGLFEKLEKAFKNESRSKVREIYFDYLEEVRIVMKQQEELRYTWSSRLDFFKNSTGNHDLRFQSWLWLLRYEILYRTATEIIERDEKALRDGNTELQFLVMTLSCKMTKLILSILKQQLTTTSRLVYKMGQQMRDFVPVEYVLVRKEFDKLGKNFILNFFAEELAAKGNGAADVECINNLEDGIKNLSSLYRYIDAEREKRIKYLPNLQVDDSNLLAESFLCDMDMKFDYLSERAKLALDKQLTQDEKLEYIYLDATHRTELDHITDMLELVGYIVRRAVLFPILEQKEVSRRTCSVCMKEEDRHLWLCSACVGVTYCGQECQEVDWPLHQIICGPSRLDNIKRKQRIQFQTIDTEKEIQVKYRVNQFYNNP